MGTSGLLVRDDGKKKSRVIFHPAAHWMNAEAMSSGQNERVTGKRRRDTEYGYQIAARLQAHGDAIARYIQDPARDPAAWQAIETERLALQQLRQAFEQGETPRE